MVTSHTLEQQSTKQRIPFFIENVNAERIKVY